ncbi:RidA family protein [Desertifilum sp. FACHB-1129]|uniref:Enamine deaminase RidA n=2 Tax=Desertifilum tharense IPPAS B-1220 TaxID=1781255 RepID=A0A1E5QI37_9CYAN|nr:MULTISPECIES: RidA family protein [Desertifilum]MDA0212035.1 RidA family protein [Cyanobacteria bacterium FC1]MBD2314398.1 RidA family protein [Desertifilum sp. FACHB-1129]MBD2324907.1 RidA family protein [Desertifilum sp. FACHB-866]MBD2335000.1 RidA family protein [Desertifilum sp. FACHB-868]OEJ74332.1 hypothetical protein BH720_15270 [Desertifilum tharense IPPAS B-1220]
MEIQRTFSGTAWETKAGYCRALRVGSQIYVSGTAPITEQGNVYAPGDAYAQTQFCIAKIQKALQSLGADLPNVVRIRLFVTDINRTEDYIKATQEAFGEHPPTNTLVGINALVDPQMLVEIEVDAICLE